MKVGDRCMAACFFLPRPLGWRLFHAPGLALPAPPHTPRGLRLPPGPQQTRLLCTWAMAALCLPWALPSRTSSSANTFSSRHSEPSWSLQVAPSPFPWMFTCRR